MLLGQGSVTVADGLLLCSMLDSPAATAWVRALHCAAPGCWVLLVRVILCCCACCAVLLLSPAPACVLCCCLQMCRGCWKGHMRATAWAMPS